VVDGGASSGRICNAANRVADALPSATRRTLPDQGHDVTLGILAPVVAEFLVP
jgi:hypothetical protein